ncbi:hypothetical protein NQ318_009906, partial [Aromia moschata]
FQFFDLIGLCLIQASGVYSKLSRSEYFSFVSATGMSITCILLFFYLYHIIEKTVPKIPWLKIELGYCALWTLLSLIAAFLTVGLVNGYLNIAGYFAFAATAVYGLDTGHKIFSVLAGHAPQ